MAELVSDQLSRGGRRLRIGPRHRLSQHPAGLFVKQLQVFTGGGAGLGHESGGLRDGQGQVTQLIGKAVGVGRAEPGHPGLKQRVNPSASGLQQRE